MVLIRPCALLRLLSPWVAGSDTTMIEGRSDADRFHSTMHALGLIGVDATVQDDMLSGLAGILYLGQVQPLRSS